MCLLHARDVEGGRQAPKHVCTYCIVHLPSTETGIAGTGCFFPEFGLHQGWVVEPKRCKAVHTHPRPCSLPLLFPSTTTNSLRLPVVLLLLCAPSLVPKALRNLPSSSSSVPLPRPFPGLAQPVPPPSRHLPGTAAGAQGVRRGRQADVASHPFSAVPWPTSRRRMAGTYTHQSSSSGVSPAPLVHASRATPRPGDVGYHARAAVQGGIDRCGSGARGGGCTCRNANGLSMRMTCRYCSGPHPSPRCDRWPSSQAPSLALPPPRRHRAARRGPAAAPGLHPTAWEHLQRAVLPGLCGQRQHAAPQSAHDVHREVRVSQQATARMMTNKLLPSLAPGKSAGHYWT